MAKQVFWLIAAGHQHQRPDRAPRGAGGEW
jgi:hypothetical protein